MPENVWFWIAGVVAVVILGPVLFYIFIPWFISPLLRLIFFPRYGFRVLGEANVPKRGPVVLTANHVTWIDALFLCAASPRGGFVLANANFFQWKPLFKLASRAGMIPVPFSGPKAQRAAITAVRDALDQGKLVAIFPEGQLTRNGFLGPFYRGLEVILKGKPEVAVVPVYLDNLWGSIFSFQGGRAFGKRPKGLRRVVNVAFGPAMTGPPSMFDVRNGILEASTVAVGSRRRPIAQLETIDPAIPGIYHPETGVPLTRSTANYDKNGVVQPGHRPGSVGLPLPGVVIRVVDAEKEPVSDAEIWGELQALLPAQPCWEPLGQSGRIDRDGFVWLTKESSQSPNSK